MHVPRIATKAQRPRRSKRVRLIIGLALLAAFGVGVAQEGPHFAHRPHPNIQPRTTSLLDFRPESADTLSSDGRTLATNKLTEMVALSRHSEDCPDVPREWSIALILLESVNPLSEEQIAAKESEMLALRTRIGAEKWCLLYAVEMKEAYLVVQYIVQDR
jgi:hypothetical protein